MFYMFKLILTLNKLSQKVRSVRFLTSKEPTERKKIANSVYLSLSMTIKENCNTGHPIALFYFLKQRTNGPVSAHLISEQIISTKPVTND